MNVSLIVPLGEGHNDVREIHWEWLRARWEALRPEWQIVEGRCRADRWSKAVAVADAAPHATGDVWVVCDADLWVESWPTLKEAAALAVSSPWVVPCGNVYRLSGPVTRSIVDLDPDEDVSWPVERSALAHAHKRHAFYRLFPGGGIFAVTPDNYHRAGGFDPRFVGWGGEDLAFAAALNTTVGQPVRLDASVWHLEHPKSKQAEKIGRPSGANDRLCRRYLSAEGDSSAMSALIKESSQWQTAEGH